MKRFRNEISEGSVSPWQVIVVCLIFFSTALQANPLGESEVRVAVETWARSVTADARPDVIVEKMEPHSTKGEVVAYIAHLAGGGFCLCGADDLVLPVYFYSPSGVYDPQNPDYQYILWEIESRLRFFRAELSRGGAKVPHYRRALARRGLLWRDLMAGRLSPRGKGESAVDGPMMVELNLTTIWKQGFPFNRLCPMGDGGRCVVGCVATAAAQIMKYWNWPPSGVGSYSYVWDGDQSCGGNVGGGELSATFSDPYDWGNMPNHCGGGCSQVEQEALSELNYEMGVAIDMNYGVCGSGANTAKVEFALEDYFLYHPDATYDQRDIEVMTEEIQWFRPMEFCGFDYDNGGHAWVIYGYNKGTDPDRQFKMNLGWGGGADGWYSCDSIDINSDGEGDFWAGQMHLTNIAPLNVVKFVGDDDPGDGSPGDPYKDIEEALDLAPDHTTLIFKAGSVNTFSSPALVVDRPLIFKGHEAIVRKE